MGFLYGFVSRQDAMGILDFLKSPQHADSTLGNLNRKGDYWRGQINLGTDGEVPLLLAGNRVAPNNENIELARALVCKYIELRPTIQRALFEHYEPYAAAVASGEDDELGEVPKLTAPDQVWEHVSLARVLIEPLSQTDTVEIAYPADWDIEHTLGARFQNLALIELNGTVI